MGAFLLALLCTSTIDWAVSNAEVVRQSPTFEEIMAVASTAQEGADIIETISNSLPLSDGEGTMMAETERNNRQTRSSEQSNPSKSQHRKAIVAPLNVYLLVKDEFDKRRQKLDGFVFQTLNAFSTASSSTTTNGKQTSPSRVYNYQDFFSSLRSLTVDGIYGKSYNLDTYPYDIGKPPSNAYTGDDENMSFYISQDDPNHPNAILYAIVNICAFLSQAMVESIQFDSCEEWNGMMSGDFHWRGGPSYGILSELSGVNGRYFPMSNACGQFGTFYHEDTCVSNPVGGGFIDQMSCPAVSSMNVEAASHPKYNYRGDAEDGAGSGGSHGPPPLQCKMKEKENDYAGYWDAFDLKFVKDVAYPSVLGAVDVEGCCWWGRGVLRTSGVCNFGRLNYYLGKRAYLEGRNSRYPLVDFCDNPGIICDITDPEGGLKYPELKWMVGLFEWIDRVQSYSRPDTKFDYMTQLKKFVDGGMSDFSFIDAVSSIVARGCEDFYCSAKTIPFYEERRKNFETLIYEIFDLAAPSKNLPRYDYRMVETWLHSKRSKIEGNILVSKNTALGGLPYFSQSYNFESFLLALRMTARYGVSDDKFFFVTDAEKGERGFHAGLVNLAGLFANAMVEAIATDSCSEISWEKDASTGSFLPTNSCGQNGRVYADEVCPIYQSFLTCPVDTDMTVEATLPTTSKPPFLVGINAPPHLQCQAGNGASGFVQSTETCCWWGRGILQTRGTCNYGKLNFHLGKRASDENRPSSYPDIDFCKDPEAICTDPRTMEMRWTVGMFEWTDRVQDYYHSQSSWYFEEELYKFVDGGMTQESFIESTNSIAAMGCHFRRCSSTLEMNRFMYGYERKINFKNILRLLFHLPQVTFSNTSPGTTPISSSDQSSANNAQTTGNSETTTNSEASSCPETCSQELCACVEQYGEALPCAFELHSVCVADAIDQCVEPDNVFYYQVIYCPFAKCIVDGTSYETCGCDFYETFCDFYGKDENFANEPRTIQYCNIAKCCLTQREDVGRSECLKDAPTVYKPSTSTSGQGDVGVPPLISPLSPPLPETQNEGNTIPSIGTPETVPSQQSISPPAGVQNKSDASLFRATDALVFEGILSSFLFAYSILF